jgi:ketosteroid isomerase-like protein
MVDVQAVATEIEMLQRMYAAFNRRDIEMVLASMLDNVDWPNGMEGGRVLGKGAVRDYWKRQFEVLDPNVEPKKFTKEADGRIAIDVHQMVREFHDGLIQSMEIRDAAGV